jgi:hypothetical protein
MKLKKTRWYNTIIAEELNMSKFTSLSKHLRIDNQIVDAILEGKMGPTGNIGLFGEESHPGNNLYNEITQFSLDAVFKIKGKNVLNKIQIYLKLLIRLIRKKGKIKIQFVIGEYWKYLLSFVISSFCYNQTISIKRGATEPRIISYISQEKLIKKGNYLQNNSIKYFDVGAVCELHALKATGARTNITLFGKQINHIVFDEVKLTKLLNSGLRLFNCWTTLQFVIQTLIIYLNF